MIDISDELGEPATPSREPGKACICYSCCSPHALADSRPGRNFSWNALQSRRSFNEALQHYGYSDTLQAVEGPWPSQAESIYMAFSWWRDVQENRILFATWMQVLTLVILA